MHTNLAQKQDKKSVTLERMNTERQLSVVLFLPKTQVFQVGYSVSLDVWLYTLCDHVRPPEAVA